MPARTHGESHKTRLYRCWKHMRGRCNRPTCKDYPNYGGRGITICPEWDDYVVFRDWALSNGYADDLTLDRIDCDKNYEPGNCRWIPMAEQSRNRRMCIWVELNGVKMILKDVCQILGLNYRSVCNRVKFGWAPEDAISVPTDESWHANPKRQLVLVNFRGQEGPLRSFCQQQNFPYNVAWHRIKSGWSAERALTTPVTQRKSGGSNGRI